MHSTASRDQARRAAVSRVAPRVILVVDDDAAVRDTLALTLELEGYEVRTAENGLDALLALRAEGPPDAIVLDLEMPVMTGCEFRSVQLADPDLAAIPVIVLSSSAHAVSANRRLPKPFDPDDLLSAIRELAGVPGT
jgi:CheY-like chemotaxis protein